MKDFAKEFYSSEAWKRCRESYKKKVGGLCERCIKKGLYVPGEIVHHKIKLTPENITRPEITLDFKNLELVCRECHGDEHQRIKKRYTIGPDGSVKIK